MNVSDIISELDDHGFSDTSTTRKVAKLNDTVADICSLEPWPFLQKTLSLTFDGTNSYPSNWPSDFSKVDEGGISNPSTGGVIGWERRGTIKKNHANSLTAAAGTANPQNYYFMGLRAQFWPVPSASVTLDMDYLCFHPVLTSASLETDILIPARHHGALVYGTLLKLYAMEDDPENAAEFKSLYDERLVKMREDLSRLQYDRPDRIIVLQDDEYFYP